MKWYYSINNEKRGPVDQAAFAQLVQQGVVTSTTAVWHEGMTEWQPYASINPNPAASMPPGATTCTHCGGTFPEGDLVMLSESLICANCKPIALQQMREGVSPDSGAEKTRKEHINHESYIKSVGLLYIIGAGFTLLVSMFTMMTSSSSVSALALYNRIYFAFAAAALTAGIGLRALKPWARIICIILSCIGLFRFPFGTLINGCILYLMVCKKGGAVFAPEYKNIIAATPHIKHRTSILVWIFAGFLIVFVALVGINAFL